jgi:NAD kinase
LSFRTVLLPSDSTVQLKVSDRVREELQVAACVKKRQERRRGAVTMPEEREARPSLPA